MAHPYAEVNTFADRYIRPGIQDQVYKGNWLTKRLMEKNLVNIDGGTQIEQAVEFDKARVTNTFGQYDILVPAEKKTIDKMVLQWKFKVADQTITDKDKILTGGNANKLANLAMTRMLGLKKAMIDNIGTGIYTATADAGDEITGLRTAIDTGNTYAGIAQGTYTWWACAGEDSSTTTITPLILQTGYGACVNASKGKEPTCGVTTQTLFDRIWTLFQPQQRYGGDMANVGWGQSIPFNGKPVVPDPKCTAAHFFWLNEDAMELFVHPDFNMDLLNWDKLPNQPHAYGCFLKWTGNLLVKEPRTCYKYTALTA